MPTDRPIDLQREFDPAQLHIIGLELRAQHAVHNVRTELLLIPLDIWLPTEPWAPWTLPCTVHTNRGDVGFTVELRI